MARLWYAVEDQVTGRTRRGWRGNGPPTDDEIEQAILRCEEVIIDAKAERNHARAQKYTKALVRLRHVQRVRRRTHRIDPSTG